MPAVSASGFEKAWSTLASIAALSTPAGHGAPATASPIGHGWLFASGSSVVTAVGVKNTESVPSG